MEPLREMASSSVHVAESLRIPDFIGGEERLIAGRLEDGVGARGWILVAKAHARSYPQFSKPIP